MRTDTTRAERRRGASPPRTVRSVIALAALAVSGFVDAGAPAPTVDTRAPATTVRTVEQDPVLVQLGDTREHASFVLQRFDIAVRGVATSQGLEYDSQLFEQLYGFLPTFLQQRATELVLMAQAAGRGIVVDDEQVETVMERVRFSLGREGDAYAAALAAAGFDSEEQLRVMVRESELVRLGAEAIRSSIEVTPEQVVVAYHANRARFASPAQVCARHVLVRERDHALALLAQLEAGAPFADVALSESLDAASAVRGGELGCMRPGMTVAPFDQALFSAGAPGLLGPVDTQYGVHLIEVYDIRPARVQPLEEVWTELEAELRAELGEAALAAIVATSGVRTFPEHIPPLDVDLAPEPAIDPAAGI
jgi:peptidyl-prolyl cis-trans isomerase C